MIESCNEINVLVRQIVDSVRVQGRGCQVDVQLDSCCQVAPGCSHCGNCNCATFISATAGPCVTLIDAIVEPAMGRNGSCVRASLLVPVTVMVRVDGANRVCKGEIFIPVEGTMRSGAGPYPELVAQATVRVCRGCYADGRVRLWVDFQAEIHAICLRSVCIPAKNANAPCRDSCQSFFNLPLYPNDCNRTYN